RAYYAMQDTQTPVIISVAAVVLNIILSWVRSRTMGYRGLARSISIASTVEAAVLLAILQRRIGIVSRELLGRAGRSLLAGALFVPYAWWSGNLLGDATDPDLRRTIWTYLLFAYALGTAVAVYLAIAYAVGAREVLELTTRMPVIGPRIERLIGPRFGR